MPEIFHVMNHSSLSFCRSLITHTYSSLTMADACRCRCGAVLCGVVYAQCPTHIRGPVVLRKLATGRLHALIFVFRIRIRIRICVLDLESDCDLLVTEVRYQRYHHVD